MEIIGVFIFGIVLYFLYKLFCFSLDKMLEAYEEAERKSKENAVKEEIAPGIWLVHNIWTALED